MGLIDTRLKQLGVVLPEPVAPVANYVPYTLSGNQLFVAGQIPLVAGRPMMQGHLGAEISIEQGAACAHQCAVNVIAQIKSACDGDLDRVKRVLKLVVFVNTVPTFVDVPKVANGASDLMVAVFGDAGRHARSSVGVASLPLGVPVEVEAIVEI